MKTNKNFSLYTIAILLFMAFASNNAFGQQSGIKRTDLQRHDLSIPGREAVQARIDFDAHTSFGKHYHPGEEIIYVLEGTLEYKVEGQGTVTLKAGEVLFIPAGTVHSAKNNTNAKASELATYVVEKGKPILVLKK
ncbi:quercetin dioxygenase-like cupin family protein [Flavobacterium sp. 90]|uniref:cupin domain-containing protein n=1 Tax=unclassified Flavobacterium TaxID=196869 RepID=UPI000EB39B3B|nr:MULTISPECIES: cupin domain-containing protein [unclassified Flavobacterium]RKR04926.1 quercetin dioxygenase-like cupin family protein [Flavobacterium sp. 81]TCK56246.1 quercetin dioxygenase-like cupin family protein [Flavobacterium sp. 90]